MKIIRNIGDLRQKVQEMGFLPFFRNGVRGFSILEMLAPGLWFVDDVDGPWEWKGPMLRGQDCAYGKFFGGKAGYISLEWLPDLVNYRRWKYPLPADSREVYDIVSNCDSILSKELKEALGMGPRRKRTAFDPVDLTGLDSISFSGRRNISIDRQLEKLQKGTWVSIADFEYAVAKNGQPYGWGLARYATPESLYGSDLLEQTEGRTPQESLERILTHLRKLYPKDSESQLMKLIG